MKKDVETSRGKADRKPRVLEAAHLTQIAGGVALAAYSGITGDSKTIVGG